MEGYKLYNERRCPALVAGHSVKHTYEYYFRSEKSKLVYIIEATYHEGNFFAVKFFCKNHRFSKNKYSLQTKTDEPFKIMWTCTQVLPKLMSKYPNVSFVAIGARSIAGKKIEDMQNTIRFKMYKRHIFNLYKEDQYILLDIPDNSGIAMVNIEEASSIYYKTKDIKQFQNTALKSIAKIKSVIIECYDDIHIPD